MKYTPTTDKRVLKSMQSNISKNTRLELQFRQTLTTNGIRGYRLHNNQLPGTPDIVISRKKIAIFVNGCFWHGCEKCNKKMPKKNAEFWLLKISRNKERDRVNYKKLEACGWTVVIVWECEKKDEYKMTIHELLKHLKDSTNFTNA